MNTCIGYKGSVEITIKNKTYRRYNHGCPELFRTLAMCLCRQLDTSYWTPTYLNMYSSGIDSVLENATHYNHESNSLLNVMVAVHPYAEMSEGTYNAVFTALILPDNLRSTTSKLTSVTVALLAANSQNILAATTISGDIIDSLSEGYSAQIKWTMKFDNMEA